MRLIIGHDGRVIFHVVAVRIHVRQPKSMAQLMLYGRLKIRGFIQRIRRHQDDPSAGVKAPVERRSAASGKILARVDHHCKKDIRAVKAVIASEV